MQPLFPLLFLFLTLSSSFSFSSSSTTESTLPSDAVSLLSFKSKADLNNKLLYSLNEPYDYCNWRGVKCSQNNVISFILQNIKLNGTFSPNSLTRLTHLRVLILRNNSLFGSIPDLSSLNKLKILLLDHNHFSGSIPVQLNLLDRVVSIRLDSNSLSGTVPVIEIRGLKIFNVSENKLTGPVPFTATLSRFDATSFSGNPGLCGEIVHRTCDSHSRFFNGDGDGWNGSGSGSSSSSVAPLGESQQSQGIVVVNSAPAKKKRGTKRNGLVLGCSVVIVILIASVIVAVVLVNKKKHSFSRKEQREKAVAAVVEEGVSETVDGNDVVEVEAVTKMRSGRLVFCCGEVQEYTLEQLMRASAEVLGRGSLGTTYKAVVESKLILTVKRFDGGKTAATSGEDFEKRMEMVGRLRHPNLVPVRAYFQAKGEKLVIFDYQPNGSLFNLVHGSRSARAKPLHWTSCLKIAEDVAHGLAYIHQASSLIHGNLKSSNVLLGVDFEACITDYGLSLFADPSLTEEDPSSTAYKAPETRKSSGRASAKSDVYSFGVLVLELLTGKHPSKHPFLMPTDLQDWVRAMRDDDGSEDKWLEMLTEVASICSATSPEQRPTMWQVLKMIQGIKESVAMEDNTQNRL
ncbi:hypothetical protein TanjilG_07675 [Lupinus angustifolius]|uniref:Protein kinase domain-containing protein n=1 Tax=Lupinus angustifolius TaxID=3871 RepID=A0A1J7GW10_LUPAN|nr:PREDICTED: probable inactive receptor kinase At5g67200 [Lupinus angustifolius]OIV93772.1 hypothetical protein TanjilG_07675 [Lupinus angustifolius]